MQVEAEAAHASLMDRISDVDKLVASSAAITPGKRPSVAFIEWPEPIYVGGHWTPQLIWRAGGSHPLNEASGTAGAGRSYPDEPEALVASNPELVIICPCGLDLQATRKEVAILQRQAWWQELPAVQNG